MQHIVPRIAAVTVLFAFAACTQMVGDEGADEPEAQAEPVAEQQDAEHEEESAEQPSDKLGRMDPQLIRSAIRTQYLEQAKGCYDAVLSEDAEAAGKVVLRFAIVDGAAEGTRVEIGEGSLEREAFKTCMREALGGVAFPVVDGKVTVSYPLVFNGD